ncbi:MAG: hypothetical protein WC942_09675 [Clostridia bacterium]|jgi:hypothetical protein
MLLFTAYDGEEEQEQKNFTQEEVNSILAKEKRKTKEAQEALLQQLEETKKSVKMSSEEKESLEKKIEELQKITMSAEERSRQKETKLQKSYDERLVALENERTEWQKRHANLVVSNDILRAASSNKAVDPNQIFKMLRGDVRLVQKVDETGKPIDSFETRIDFEDRDKDDKPITLDLTVEEAIKRMKELPQYGNLFEGSKASGMGGNNAGSAGAKGDILKVVNDPQKYRELRTKNPNLAYK